VQAGCSSVAISAAAAAASAAAEVAESRRWWLRAVVPPRPRYNHVRFNLDRPTSDHRRCTARQWRLRGLNRPCAALSRPQVANELAERAVYNGAATKERIARDNRVIGAHCKMLQPPTDCHW